MKAKSIVDAVEAVTKKWAKQRKSEERAEAAFYNRRNVMTRRRGVTIKDAAWDVMEDAYLSASANGTLPALARQVMYAARPHVLEATGRDLSKGFDGYFTQTLLPDYVEDTSVDWNVVYDARGHFQEPHTGKIVPLGTLQVRKYLDRIKEHAIVEDTSINIVEDGYPTMGPKNRYSAILFVEKEGFMPLFEEVKLAERYDLALTSTKGMSNTAFRELIDDVDIQAFVLHDFDKSGFSIVGTLQRNTRRFTFSRDTNKVIDFGLRLEDVKGLETEPVYSKESRWARSANLRENGATKEEIEFLLDRRVELNALTSDALVALIERKLKKHGITKVVPDKETLADAYRRISRQLALQKVIDNASAKMDDDDESVLVPGDLKRRIAKLLKADPTIAWDAALRKIAEESEP